MSKINKNMSGDLGTDLNIEEVKMRFGDVFYYKYENMYRSFKYSDIDFCKKEYLEFLKQNKGNNIFNYLIKKNKQCKYLTFLAKKVKLDLSCLNPLMNFNDIKKLILEHKNEEK